MEGMDGMMEKALALYMRTSLLGPSGSTTTSTLGFNHVKGGVGRAAAKNTASPSPDGSECDAIDPPLVRKGLHLALFSLI